jgi:hypothetical protein
MTTCPHRPPCPPSDRPDHDAAKVISTHPEQGWSLLCNGVIVFDDLGELLPDGRAVAPRRAAAAAPAAAAQLFIVSAIRTIRPPPRPSWSPVR